MAKRCPDGSRKDRKTGNCVKKTGTVLGRLSLLRKRCPKGTKRNKKTGDCVATRKKSPVRSRARSPVKSPVKSASPSLSSFYTPPEYRARIHINRET